MSKRISANSSVDDVTDSVASGRVRQTPFTTGSFAFAKESGEARHP